MSRKSLRRTGAIAAKAAALAVPAVFLSSAMASAQVADQGARTANPPSGQANSDTPIRTQKLAANTQSDASTRIGEVIVTARKREESLQSVPIAITAITPTMLKAPYIRDLRDIVTFTPNVRIDSIYQRANAPSITIRGISATRTDDNSIDSPIGVLIDGIYLGSLPGQIIENFDLERIEVLRGPQGTLFGRNTVGGVLSVIRTQPTGEWGVKAQYTTGSWNDQEFGVVLNAPILKDKLALKLFLISENRDGYLHNTFLNINQPQKNYKNFGGVLKFTPNNWFTGLLTVEKYDDQSQGGAFLGNYNVAPGVLPPPTTPSDFNAPPHGSLYPSGGVIDIFLPGIFGLTNVPPRTNLALPNSITDNFPSPGSVQTYAYTLNMTARLNSNLSLVSLTGYRKQNEKASEDFDGSSTDFITIATDAHFHQFSEELRLQGNWDSKYGKISLTSGLYYYNSAFDRHWVTAGEFWNFVPLLSSYSLANNVWLNPALAAATGYADPISACLSPVPRVPAGVPGSTPQQNQLFATFGAVRCDPGVPGGGPGVGYGPNIVNKLFETQQTDSVAFFSNASWEFYPKFTLTAGVRYTWERKHFVGYQSYLLPASRIPVDAFPGNADLTNSWTHWTPTVMLAYQMTPAVMWYASFAEGWHSGGFFGVNQNAADFIQNQYKPENATSYELGMKGQFFDHRVQLNLAAFLNDFTNKQESAIVFDKTTNTVVTLFTNVGGLRYEGIEAELQWIINKRLSVAGSFGYLNAYYTQLLIGYPGNQTVPVPIVNATFLTPRNAPKFTLGGSANYTVPLGPGDLSLGTQVTWVDSVYGDIYNTSTAHFPSHTNVDVSLTYNFKTYSASVFGRNLTNYRLEAPVIIAPLFGASTITPGASWGLQLTAKF